LTCPRTGNIGAEPVIASIEKENIMTQVENVLDTAKAPTTGGRDGASPGSDGQRGLTVSQRVAICFAAGVIGGLAVVLFSHLLFALGLSTALGVTEPVSLKPPDIYRPLFWAGLWGIPFGLLLKAVWARLYLVGFLYFLAPVLALFLFFLPMSGAGFFGLQHGGPMFTAYLVLVNLPFGIVTALVAGAIIGNKP
jgi:hypothetical protein